MKGYNKSSDCKVNGTENSILNAVSQTLRKLPCISRKNGLVTGKFNGTIFAAYRLNKFDLNIDDYIYTLSKLKSIEMMYNIEKLTISIGSVSEIQRKFNAKDIVNVVREHPNDSDEVAFKFYNYIWVTTKIVVPSSRINTNDFPDVVDVDVGVDDGVVGGVNDNEEDSTSETLSSDSEDIMPEDSD